MKVPTKFICLFLSVLLVGGSCMGKESRLTAEIEVISGQHAQANGPALYLNGYCKSIGGQTIAYHSSHPDAEDALLVRARRDVPSISWETDTLARSFPGDYYQFIWLAGIECRGWGTTTPPREFKLFINDELWFTFLNRKDSSASHWTVAGKAGGTLTFDSQATDKFGDLFGYMYLKIPKSSFSPGSPLVLRIEGADADSPDWFMTFTYHFNFVPQCRPEPARMIDHGVTTQQLRVSLDNLEYGREVKVSIPGQKVIRQPLAIGGNVMRIPIPSVETATPMSITFIKDKVVDSSTITITPVPKRNIYLLPYSHNDIGYTDLQPNVERKHWSHLEEALRLIRKTREYPVESRFKWNMEVLWPLDSYLKQASSEKRQEVLEAIRNGSIGLNALYANPLTGLANATEMAHYLDFAREFSSQYGISIDAATVSDIPGFTWGIVSALAQSGVKYFSSAPNAGDRVGFATDQWGDKPFYWLSQSGQEKVLFWLAGSSYSSFHQGTLSQVGADRIMKLGRKLTDTQYPYEDYYLPYTLGDNGGPDSTLSSFVKAWNERYQTPTLIIATHDQMFKDFESKYGATLPTHAGDFTPYWEDGACSSARETALSRQAVDRLIQAEALWSIRSPESFPEAAFSQAWREVTLWDEHTWGADKSVSDPDDPMTIGQWKIKQEYALRADSLSSALLSQAVGNAKASSHDETALDIYNTLSWVRSDIVILDGDFCKAGDRVVDEHGNVLASQRLSTGELAVLVENVPPLSSKRILVRKGNGTSKGSALVTDGTISNNLLSVRVDKNTGAIASVIDKSFSAELMDSTKVYGANQYIYVPGKNPDSAQFLSNVRVRTKESGPLVASLLIEADAPGCAHFVTEVRLTHNLKCVDIINQLNKNANRTKEGAHFAFPFNISDGTLRYDVASGIVRPELDQLAGACKNFYSVVSWVDISNESSGITWTTSDAPLIEIGAITAERPWMKTNQSSSCFYSYVMNNYWHTNYRADQEGSITFRYGLFPHGRFDALQATRSGRERRQPLIAARAGAENPLLSPLFEVAPDDVVVESVKPIDDGRAWLVYLYNPDARSREIQLMWHRPNKVGLSLCDSFGKRGAPIDSVITLPAFGTQYVRVDGNRAK